MHIDMLGIVVSDIAESVRFYRTLGFDANMPEDGGPYTEFVQSNGLRISLNHIDMIKGMEPNWETPVGHRMGMALLCAAPSDVDQTFEKVLAAGFAGHKAPWDAFWGQRYAQVLDPDGNIVDLFAPL